MNIAIVTSSLFWGGAETQIANLAPRLAARNWQVTVLAMIQNGPVAAQLKASGISVVDLGLKEGGLRLSSFFKLYRMGKRLIGELKIIQPEIVHSHMVPANLICRLLRLKKRSVLVCTAHSIIEPPAWKNLAYRITDRLCDVTTNICRAGVERSIRDGRVPAGRVIHIANGVDTKRFHRDMEDRKRLREQLGVGDRFVWLSMGRLCREKDWPTMLKAFAIIENSNNQSFLLIAGDGPMMEETKKLILELGITNAVQFLGIRTDTPALYSCADGFIMSSSVEGLPMVLLEASSSELPIVATAVGGVPEIVEDGVTGLLAAPGDPDQLANLMSRVETMTPSSREEMGRAGRNRTVEMYDIDAIVEQWEELYLKLLAEHTRRDD